jgi:2-dehydropantoate 2-reductase
MRIAVMGAGGIGSYLGALLAKSGADVTLICRGAHLAAVREHGLRVRSAGGEFTVSQMAASDDPTLAGSAEIIIQAVKLYDLGASTRALAPSLGPRSLVVTVQNGVTAADEAGAIVGRDRVVPGLVFINAHLEAPGVVVSRGRSQTFIIGPHDARIAAFQERCAAAGIDARISPDIRADLWRKFIPVAALSALACLCRQPIGPILADPALARLHRQAMEEVAGLARTKEVNLETDIVERMLALARTYQYDARVSMLEDLEAGKRLELEWLSGYVSREAARQGVPVPFHDLAYACLKPLAK